MNGIKTFLFILYGALLIVFFNVYGVFAQWSLVLRSMIIVSIIVLMWYEMLKLGLRQGRMSEAAKNRMLLAIALVTLLLSLEIGFYWYPKSHGADCTFASQIWFNKFWKTNSLGYRDLEPGDIDTDKKNIIFVGDSFTAGHGIRDPENRFSNIVRKHLRGQYDVFNMGRNDFSTRDEYSALEKFPIKADMIVLEYFGNDIQDAGKDFGYQFDFEPFYGSKILEILAGSSSTFNFFYWRLPEFHHMNTFISWMKNMYNDQAVMKIHRKETDALISYSQKEGANLIVVLFPLLNAVEESAFFMEPMLSYLSDRGIQTLDVRACLQDLVLEDRIVNDHDAHPSIILNRRVGQRLIHMIESLPASHTLQAAGS